MDSGIYDTISNEGALAECETALSTAVINDIPCNRQSNNVIENGDESSTSIINTTGAEIFQNTLSESDSMQNPSVSEEPEMRENKIEQNRAKAANINFESNTVVKESIFDVEALGLQQNQEKEKQVDEIIIQAEELREHDS
jgi:polynucleotide 5'-kinase involved in rRNA processing